MLPYRQVILSAAAAVLMFPGPALADEPRPGGDRLRVDSPAEQDRDMPVHGMPMDNVRDLYGEPRNVKGPVGDPPITRWDYDGFSVYFEHRLVLHSVDHENHPDVASDVD